MKPIRNPLLRFIPLLFAASSLAASAADPSGLRLPAVLGDNMVLQQGQPVPIWGWAPPQAKVKVAMGGQSGEATAGADGRWSVKLDPLAPAPDPLKMEISATAGSATASLVVTNIVVGEVWICSGQSNMQMGLKGTANDTAEIAQADHSGIRLFSFQGVPSLKPVDDCQGRWLVCSPANAGGFSAVGYYFGRQLHQQLKAPVGLIQSAWGGTGAESWISREGLQSEPVLQAALARIDQDAAAVNRFPKQLKLDDANWMKPEFDDGKWDVINLPMYWDYVLYPVEYDGVVWARKTVEIPADWAGQKLRLEIGPVDDFETTYFNGVEVGKTTQHSLAPRSYPVPPEQVKAGKAVIAVRTTKIGWGGICGKKEMMQLVPADVAGKTPISIAGEWKYAPSELTFRILAPSLPSSLFNGMVAPFTACRIRGAIWYQGEANAHPGTAFNYRKILPALINDWRAKWGAGDAAAGPGTAFPFYVVQLTNFMAPTKDPNQASDWALLRESQMKTLAVPNTGMAVIIDIGEAADIHPKNKLDVGLRLARWALTKIYGQAGECSGPLYDGMTVEGGKVRIRFTHVGSGLVVKGGGPLAQFAVAGADKQFVWADAAIQGDTVEVSSPRVPQPAAVRYAWADNPEGCNLYNQEGLPASPFRTDEW